MRSDDAPSTGLTDDERRRFHDLARRFDRSPPAGSWRLAVPGWAWWCAAGAIVLGTVVLLGSVPVVVSFAGFVVALVVTHEATGSASRRHDRADW